MTIGVAAKGRSPSKALNHEQRRTMPYLVGPDIQEGGLWVDSKRNPADHPSRNRPIPRPAPPATWVARFLAGDLHALDRRLGLLPQHGLAHDWKTGQRIGEADHPGPEDAALATWAQAGRTRRAASRPPVVLREEAQGEASTRERRSRFLGRFFEWLAKKGHPTDLENISAPVADRWLEEYGQHLYDSGAGSNELAETINAVKKRWRHLEGWRQLGSAWDTLSAWQSLEPGESHAPLPPDLCSAIAVVALAWGWVDFAVVLLLGFHCALRPGEMVALRRRCLVLPSDMLTPLDLGFVVLEEPKTRKRSARRQHVKIAGPRLLSFLDACTAGLSAESPIWGPDGDQAQRSRRFRLQWNAILAALRVDSSDATGFVPASVRAGGITWLYQQTHDLQLIRWVGRWDAERTMAHYLQELPAALAVARLPVRVRFRIGQLAKMLPAAIQHARTARLQR